MIDRIITYLPQIKKSIAAGVAAATAYYGGAQVSGGAVDGIEWAALVLIGVGGGLLTWATPKNAEPGT